MRACVHVLINISSAVQPDGGVDGWVCGSVRPLPANGLVDGRFAAQASLGATGSVCAIPIAGLFCGSFAFMLAFSPGKHADLRCLEQVALACSSAGAEPDMPRGCNLPGETAHHLGAYASVSIGVVVQRSVFSNTLFLPPSTRSVAKTARWGGSGRQWEGGSLSISPSGRDISGRQMLKGRGCWAPTPGPGMRTRQPPKCRPKMQASDAQEGRGGVAGGAPPRRAPVCACTLV